MMPIPNGFVPLADAFNAVGVATYGEGWLGNRADALARISSQARYKGARSAHDARVIAEATQATAQRWDVFGAMHRDFLGSPPTFADAVPVSLISDGDGQIHRLHPEIWINDQEATQMLASGKVLFHPESPNWRWSPTGERISGMLLVAEKSLPGRADTPKAQPSQAATPTVETGVDLARRGAPDAPADDEPAGADIASSPAQADDAASKQPPAAGSFESPAQAEDGVGDLSSPPSPTASEAPLDHTKPGSTIAEPPEVATPAAAPPGPKPREKSPKPADASPIPNKPGGGGLKMAAAIAAMIKAVLDGDLSYSELRRRKQKELTALYPDAKRTLLHQARKKALDELSSRGYSDK